MAELFEAKNTPHVFTNLINEWEATTWTPVKLADMLHDVQVSFRIGRKNHPDVQFETECCYEDATVQQFCDWLKSESSLEKSNDTKNPLLKYERDKFFCYADYKYMKDMFAGDHNVLKQVDWRAFGLPEEKCEDSTLWVGSEGAYTVCHYDTYGWNLVAQIYGRKRWILFPPSESDNVYPTRVPYEESSVFSQVNIARPNLFKHPKFKDVNAHCVTLGPGDVLYVPRHWWHYVQCLEPAISVNTWVDLEADRDERMKEAVTRTLVHSMLSGRGVTWLNPTEEESSMETNVTLLNYSLKEQFSKDHQASPEEYRRDVSPDKQPSLHLKCDEHASIGESRTDLKDCSSDGETHREDNGGVSKDAQKRSHVGGEDLIPRKKAKSGSELLTSLFDKLSGIPLNKLTFSEYLQTVGGSDEMHSLDEENAANSHKNEKGPFECNEYFTITDFTQCIVDTEVINLMCKKIKSKYAEKSGIH